MRQTNYKLTLSDGLRVDVPAYSSGEAIEKALRDNLGRTVAKCYSGMTHHDCDVARTYEKEPPLAGLINHDIPPHVAYTELTAPVAHARRLPDETVPMFPHLEPQANKKARKKL